MCGIVGYAGQRPGKPIILEGLRRLEYRGYDSAGIVLIEDGELTTVRAVGNLDALFAAAGEDASPATVGLGHTRWATHGRPSHENAHPHDDCTGRICRSGYSHGHYTWRFSHNYIHLRCSANDQQHFSSSRPDYRWC